MILIVIRSILSQKNDNLDGIVLHLNEIRCLRDKVGSGPTDILTLRLDNRRFAGEQLLEICAIEETLSSILGLGLATWNLPRQNHSRLACRQAWILKLLHDRFDLRPNPFEYYNWEHPAA